MYHIVFIHSSLSGHLGYFHVLAIVNSAAMNIGVNESFQKFSFIWIFTQKWDWWIIWQLYFQRFKEPPYCSPQWPHQFTFPPTVWESSLFSTPSSAFVICRLFDDGRSDWYEVMDTSLMYISLEISDVEHFSCAYWPFVCLLWRKQTCYSFRLKFKCTVLLRLNFVSGLKFESNSFFCPSVCLWTSSWASLRHLRLCPFAIELSLLLCQRSVDCMWVVFILGSLVCSIVHCVRFFLPVPHRLDYYSFLQLYRKS